MNPEQVALLTDARLSDAARVLGLHLSTLGEGDHEMKFDTLATLLHGCPNRDTVGRHMRQLEVFGYVERVSAGGVGSPRFRWSARENSRPEPYLPVKIHAEEPHSSSTIDSSIPPIVPLPIDGRAVDALEKHDALLAGCRDALRDYLQRRVPRDRQSAYVHSIACYLNGTTPNVYVKATGGKPPMAEWAGITAAALNELMAHGERAADPPMKYQDGDIRNLRTKIEMLLKQGSSSWPQRTRRPAKNDTPQNFQYDETKVFRGFTR